MSTFNLNFKRQHENFFMNYRKSNEPFKAKIKTIFNHLKSIVFKTVSEQASGENNVTMNSELWQTNQKIMESF